MDPTLRHHPHTALPAPPGNFSTWPHAHETPATPDTGGTPPIRHTRSGKTRRTTTYGTTYGTSKTIRCRSTPNSTRNGTPTWTRSSRTSTTSSSWRTNANAPALEATHPDPRQRITRLLRETPIIR